MSMLDEWASTKTAAECEAILTEGDVPCSRYFTVRETLAQPHLAERGSFEVIDDGAGAAEGSQSRFQVAKQQRQGAQLCAGARRRQRRGPVRCTRLFKGYGSQRYTIGEFSTASVHPEQEDLPMADILAVGITHYPPLCRTRRDHVVDPEADAGKSALCPRNGGAPKTGPKRCARNGAPTKAPPPRGVIANGCVQALRKTRAQIDEFRPDFIVIWGDDQYENFREDVIPPYCIYAHEVFRVRAAMPNNIWNEPADKKFHSPGNVAAAKYLAVA